MGWGLLSAGALVALLTGCAGSPAGSGPTAYEAGVYAPGRNTPAGSLQAVNVYPAYPNLAAPYATPPVYAGSPMADSVPGPRAANRVAPPPSASVPAQYADWLFDGPEGRGFAYYLADGYRRYAKHEDNAHDFEDAAKFLARAGAVERGERVEPETLGMRTLPAYAVDDLLYARQRLMAALNRGAAQRLPKLAANAQVAFDCWMEQQEENLQPHDVAKCRRDFEAFIVRLEEKPMPEKPTPEALSCAPCQAAPACPPPPCDAQPSSVYFDLGRHELTLASREALARVAEQARRQGGKTPLIVTAHTDRAGSDAANMALSKRRQDGVIEALLAAGIPAELLTRAEHFGESQPRVPTADGVKLQENRRVELRFACAPAAEAACPAPAPGKR